MPSSAQPHGPSLQYDIYAHHGRNLIEEFDTKLRLGLPRSPPLPTGPIGFPRLTSHFAVFGVAAFPDPVGILGAGAGGLYTALILEDLGIPYKILEAREEVGGRLFTYKFPDASGAPYNYFDVGAMRFPKIDAMDRMFKLFSYPPLNTGGTLNLADKLVPFYFKGAGNNNTLYSYNGVTVVQNAMPSVDPFKAKRVIQDTDSAPYVATGTKAITDDVLDPFASRLLQDLKDGGSEGWKYMKKFDDYSTRAYMTLKYLPSASLGLPNKSLPTDVVNWCETFDKSTGWYDRALSETVLEAVAFGWQPGPNPPATPWFCIDGGAQEIARCMATYINTRNPSAFIFNSRVTSIAGGEGGMEVVTNNSTTHQFSHVISTIPLPVLRTIDLSGADLSPMQANALRQLNYGPSIKIGMQFKTAWWTSATDRAGRPLNIVGGQTYTDRPLRTVVYPSFGNVQAGTTTTLIASYCWTEDATRLGALIGSDEHTMVELVLRELADLHNLDVSFLRGQLIDYKGWDWTHDPLTMGAFAFFGPGKFKNVYTSLNTPAANGYLHFAGEAISVRHAWVEGALDSAWRAVSEMLMFPPFQSYREKFYKNWGMNPEWLTADHKYEQGTVPKVGDSLLFEHCVLSHPEFLNV